jgi:hypothetical protein
MDYGSPQRTLIKEDEAAQGQKTPPSSVIQRHFLTFQSDNPEYQIAKRFARRAAIPPYCTSHDIY